MNHKAADKAHGIPTRYDPELYRPELYTNREISLLSFIARVLGEAQSSRHPLLERVKFLAFVSSQLDEFIMLRIAGLHDQVYAQVAETGPDGMLPNQQLDALRPLMQLLYREQHECVVNHILPQAADLGIAVLDYAQLSRPQREAAELYFSQAILPVLTPLGVDPGHPFPHISSRSLNLAVMLHDPISGELFARVKVPGTLRRLVPVPLAGRERIRLNGHGAFRRSAFVWIEQLIAAHLDQLFPGMRILAAHPFRVLRDADFEVQSDEAGDLLETVEEGLRQRRFGSVINLSVQPEMPERVRELLRENLEIGTADVWQLAGPLDLGGMTELLDLDRPELKDPPLVPRVPPEVRRSADVFAAVRQGDMLLHHPYDSFNTVAEFVESAARDPQVLAIKTTLYRVGHNSPIVNALLEANERGKQVAVLVELKARFDEVNNIEWARRLEREGVHVVYGQASLKTHAKVALVVRQEAAGLVRYVHLGTGNYNASTARVYEDYAQLTSRPDIGEDATNLFNALTGFARGLAYHKLLVAPETLRSGLLWRIEREIDRRRAGGQGHLIFKTNSLVDPEFIRALYHASQAGVKVDLIVRGMCCLRPGIPGISEHIRVVSVVGRFLEHSRIFYFANGGAAEDEVLLGSADLMPRNLDRRVEVVFPVEDRALRAHLVTVVLPAYLRDTANTHLLHADGTYERLKPAKGEEAFDVQAWFAHEAQVGARAD